MFDQTNVEVIEGRLCRNWRTVYYLRDGVCVGKTCSKCRRHLPADRFGYSSQRSYSLGTYCRDCVKRVNAERGSQSESHRRRRVRNVARSDEQVLADQQRTRPQGVKKCVKCLSVKTLESFYPTRSNTDGLQQLCKTCSHLAVHAVRARAYEAHWRARGIPLKCYVCQGPYEDVEHVIPQSHPNGHDVPENTLPSCALHNRGAKGKHDKDLLAWLLSRNDLPRRGEVLARVVKYGVWPSGDTTPQEFMKRSIAAAHTN